MKHITLFFLTFFMGTILWAQSDTSSLGVLPAEVWETSGLLFHQDALVTHNDSGNDPNLFVLDTVSLEITRTVTISNAENVDWEDLAQDDEYIYIGDIGNNQGTRTDLGIYRITKQDFDASDTVMAEKINYAYEDQTDFSGGANSDWDAEAIIVVGEYIILFTKQWQSNGTVAYQIPKSPGNHQAVRLESFASNGLITGGIYNPLSEVVFLSGYSQQLFPFVVRIENITDTFAFGMPDRITLPLSFMQIEAITYSSVNRYYLTSERFVNASPPITLESQLFVFTTTDMLPEDPPPDPDPDPEPEPEPIPEGPEGDILLYSPIGSPIISYQNGISEDLYGRAIFDSTGRRVQYTPASEISNNDIDLSALTKAVYYLTFYFDGRIVSKPFIKQ